MARFIFLAMFEKWTKKIAGKATDGAIEGAAQSLSEKFGQYMDMIQIGLVLGVIAIGTHHLTKKRQPVYLPQQSYIPTGLPAGQPVIVNNYYHEREEQKYDQRIKRQHYIQQGQVCQQKTGKAYTKR